MNTVAAELAASLASGMPAALVLGAGSSVASGIPLWEDFASEVLCNLAVETNVDEEETAVQMLEEFLRDNPFQRDLVLSYVDTKLGLAVPSRGYRYLAQLVREGYYRTIITTNWDSLLEDALYRLMRSHEVMVLTRDEGPDEVLARAITNAGNRVVVLKLHGDPKTLLRTGEDLSTRSVPRTLLDALAPRIQRVHIVGNAAGDLDVLQLLFERVADSDVLAVSPDPDNIREPLKSIASATVGGSVSLASLNRRAHPADGEHINVGEFDHYFCQLTLSIERRSLKTADRQTRLAEIETALLRKEEVGLSYINSSQLSRMARAFVGKITREGTPDIVFFVNDPSAPGGMELKKRIEGELVSQGVAVGVLLIEGEKNNRSFRRSFRGPDSGGPTLSDGDPGREITNVHILDSITFSGNTLQIARSQVRTWYPRAEVRLGALVVSQMLLEHQALESVHERIYYDSVTDRFEIFFPWGVTQTTSDFNRKFPGVDKDRLVRINRRPWGAIEVLVDEEPCSVRLLTIEAGRRLSFQRHLCRDELFVALDDNIGLDVCAADLDPTANIFDPAVKSMVLEKGDYILVSRGVWHRTKASMDRARLLEVAFGVYDQVYDIERLFDDFNRTEHHGGV